MYRDLQAVGLLRLERGIGTSVTEPPKEQVVREDDFRAIAEMASELIALSQQAGLRPNEVTQLIETLWKENSDVER